MAEPDVISWIMNQAGRYPLMTASEELLHGRYVQAWQELGVVENPTAAQKRIIRQGKRSFDRFFHGNLRLVINVASKYKDRSKGIGFEDLIQEGSIGLRRAIEKFDPSRGYKFSTYAFGWIRQGVTRAISTQSRTIRLPIHAHDILNRVRYWAEDYQRETGRTPTDAQCAEVAGVSEEYLKHYLAHDRWMASIDAPLKLDGRQPVLLSDSLAAETEDPLLATDTSMALDVMRNALPLLPERQREVLILRYGLNGDVPRSLVEIGKGMGCTRETIRTAELRALAELRKHIGLLEGEEVVA